MLELISAYVITVNNTNLQEIVSHLQKQAFFKLIIVPYSITACKTQYPYEDTEWGAIVLDEGHKIKNAGAITTKFFFSLRRFISYLLTGKYITILPVCYCETN